MQEVYDAKMVWTNIYWSELLGPDSPASKHFNRVQYHQRLAKREPARHQPELIKLARQSQKEPLLSYDLAKLEFRNRLQTKLKELEDKGQKTIPVLTMRPGVKIR